MHELIKKIKQFRQERDWDQYHSPKNLVMALSVEVAELVEHFQWLTQEESRNLSDEKLDQVRDEIGDILIYLANLSEKLGIDPVQAAHAKIEKNQIKYPAQIVKGRHTKYSEYD
jgi:NTP pyrophosphatase (non-canonical NTP hydrolase)